MLTAIVSRMNQKCFPGAEIGSTLPIFGLKYERHTTVDGATRFGEFHHAQFGELSRHITSCQRTKAMTTQDPCRRRPSFFFNNTYLSAFPPFRFPAWTIAARLVVSLLSVPPVIHQFDVHCVPRLVGIRHADTGRISPCAACASSLCTRWIARAAVNINRDVIRRDTSRASPIHLRPPRRPRRRPGL